MPANVNSYQERLRALLDNPGSFTESPGYRFAVDQGLQAAQRSGSRMRGSGNVLAELTRLGAGYASQEYGNQVDRMGRLLGQEQQYDIGQTANANTATRNANDFTLGTQANANTRRRNDQDYGLGLSNNSTNWFNAVTGRRRQNADAYFQGDQGNRAWYDRFFT